ncbi:alkaline-phosphatase-like protein [Crucibulum laeve]|uniref:alkaline phosphatase n=1 Tax=Crucibulum laeve TaxID=68775 RepID=A0A5C3MGZ9_9AGAR|nr:alkaline-phosphatase-like protein [Crucibulum laeve]
MKRRSNTAAAAFLLGATLVSAQTFHRLGGCPTLGCVFPPDQTDFLSGQLFDIRLEVHAPINGSEAHNAGVPDEKFTFCIQNGSKGECKNATQFFGVKEPALEKWTFSYYEDLFARDAKTPAVVNVASKAYRALSLTKPGDYVAKLKYNNVSQTVAHWTVRQPATTRKAKNVLFFIGDGMTQPMITAARLIAHKSINGRYQSLMQMDQMDNLGHQMTHSLDSFITDSANSATALYTGKKSSVNALNVYADSSKNSFDDPKVETIAELFRRRIGGPIGIVSTAYIADATPAALCAHTRDRNQYAAVVYEYLNSANGWNTSLPWPTSCEGPDVIFGGGAEQFIAGPGSPNGTDYYKAFADKGYNVIWNNTALQAVGTSKKTLGIFSVSNMAKWIDRHVLTDNLKGQKNSPNGDGTDALDQPGLKDMTLKAIDILQARATSGNGKGNNKGWFMMSEAASIDKMMHVLDYDRALGELLELDDTIRASIEHLKKIGEYENTLIVITADHGHGFDVFGGADTKYLAAQTDERKKRDAIGVYESSGLSGYTVAEGSLPTNDTIVFGSEGPNFPVQWNPRYAYAAGFGANPDHRESYTLNQNGPRVPATKGDDGTMHVNPTDHTDGFNVGGTLDGTQGQGVHSLQDVSVFANGPGSEAFRGVYNSIDIFFKIADALALGNAKN